MMLIIPVLAIPLRGNSSSGSQKQTDIEQSIGEALREAFGHHSFLLLVSGFFVCGFQVAFITAHFPAYLRDIIIADSTYAVLSLALIGFFNIIGSLASGIIGQRHSKPVFLALIYIGRSIAVTAFLLLPQTPTSVVVSSPSSWGFCGCPPCRPPTRWWQSCSAHAISGMLGGVVFFSHQIGSFLGVWLGGYLYDIFGSYDPCLVAGRSPWAISPQSSTGRSRNRPSTDPLGQRNKLWQSCGMTAG
jgi:predicted MFS family arabinose efflux permease